uniref:OCIA domain-containing protein n=1 Tax=Trichuris muris TaxID=70415 RepID=A0A5S6QFH3_TRIMR
MESNFGNVLPNSSQAIDGSPMMAEGQQQPEAFVPARLSFEELAVLRECARESFFYRCVPLAAGSCLVLKYLNNVGMVKAHPIYGLSFKYAAVIGIGYILGKLSYLKECHKKIFTRIPSSNLADAIRKRDAGQFPRIDTFMLQGSNDASSLDKAVSNSAAQQSTDDYAFYNPDFTIGKPIDDGQDSQERKETKARTDYDDLRMANRRDFLQNYVRNSQPVKGRGFQPPAHGERDGPVGQDMKTEDEPQAQPKLHRGKYGDEGFN